MSNQYTEIYWENRFDQIMEEIGGNFHDPDKATDAVMRRIELEQREGGYE